MYRRDFLITSLAPAWAAPDAQTPATPEHPALIPYPRHIQWTAPVFDGARYEMEAPPAAQFAAAELARALDAAGARRRAGAPNILLWLGAVNAAGEVGADEAYSFNDYRLKPVDSYATETSMGLARPRP